ncbi:MAG: DUF488 domain-containing protein [Desulfotignum sp.]|nr:DUF488 domain-containing protein [Desulfotignum sp.]
MDTLFTIGFTKKSARQFFTLLQSAGVHRLVDVRLNNASQLAGFAKKNDLAYFLEKICGIDYIHLPIWAPDQALLEQYKKKKLDFTAYEKKYLALLKQRNIEKTGVPQIRDKDCLLCSEHESEFCHRRLAAEYTKTLRPDMAIVHLQ